MKYEKTKKQCQAQIDKRMPVVCCGCGGNIEPIKTFDNSHNPTYWSGCLKCMCFDGGTEPKTYEIAKKMVEDCNFRPYRYDKIPDKDKEPERFEYWKSNQVKGAVYIVNDILRFNESYKEE